MPANCPISQPIYNPDLEYVQLGSSGFSFSLTNGLVHTTNPTVVTDPTSYIVGDTNGG